MFREQLTRQRTRWREDPRNDGSKTYKNLHRGARAFSGGLYAAIRNPGMHVPHDGGEDSLPMEQLAAFSRFARRVDQADALEA